MSGPTALSSKLTNADTSSILTNNQQKFPLNAAEASKMFEKYLTEYEKREIFEYQTVYGKRQFDLDREVKDLNN